MFKRKQFGPQSFDGKIITCSSFAIKYFELELCQQFNLGETYYYQTVKLRTQNKLYEKSYSQMMLAI